MDKVKFQVGDKVARKESYNTAWWNSACREAGIRTDTHCTISAVGNGGATVTFKELPTKFCVPEGFELVEDASTANLKEGQSLRALMGRLEAVVNKLEKMVDGK